MLHGTVKYKLKAGGETTVDWAAHAQLVKEGDMVKMEFYQVYLVGCSYRLCVGFVLIATRILVRKTSEECKSCRVFPATEFHPRNILSRTRTQFYRLIDKN